MGHRAASREARQQARVRRVRPGDRPLRPRRCPAQRRGGVHSNTACALAALQGLGVYGVDARALGAAGHRPLGPCLLLVGWRCEPHPHSRADEDDLPSPFARLGTFRKDAINTDTGVFPEDLRNRLVDAILDQDPFGLRDARVETAMRTVPHHAFLPE